MTIFSQSLDRPSFIVASEIDDCVYGASGPLYQYGNETMAMVNQGLVLLVPIRIKAVSSHMF